MMHSSSPMHGNMYSSSSQQNPSLNHVQHLLGSLEQQHQQQTPSRSNHNTAAASAASAAVASSSSRASSSHNKDAEEDVTHVRWSVELVMILVRNINQDRVLIQSLIQNELAKSKQHGEVRDSTIYQYINRIKRWARGAYEADVRSGGIARKELQQRDRRLTEAEEQAKADFTVALKKEFKSMTFNSSQILEIINLGRSLKGLEERGEAKGERRKSSSVNATPLSIGPSTTGMGSFEEYSSSSAKKKKPRFEHDSSSMHHHIAGGNSGGGGNLNATESMGNMSTAVGEVVAQAIAQYTKVTIQATQDTTQTIMNAMQNFMSMQTQAEQRRIEREERDREERRRERKEERKLLRKLAEIKGISSFDDDESE